MRVKDCMCKNVVKANSDTPLNEVAQMMQENNIGVIPICNKENNIVGFITDRDIITRCVAQNKSCNQTRAFEIMTKDVIKTTPDTEISNAIHIMAKNQIKRLPVIENNQIVGMLTVGDLAQQDDVSSELVGNTVEGICGCQNN